MAQAIKCDRCGEFCIAHKSGEVISPRLLQNALKDGHYPEKIDLCEMCLIEIRGLLKTWWRGKEQP